jgi:hypothetical protein
MKSEEQWRFRGRCIECNSPVFIKGDKIKWTGKNCNCRLLIDEDPPKERSPYQAAALDRG